MALTAAQLLDELMGKDRNLVPGEKSAQVPWDHGDVRTQHLIITFLMDGIKIILFVSAISIMGHQ